jgi:hypothetical protein
MSARNGSVLIGEHSAPKATDLIERDNRTQQENTPDRLESLILLFTKFKGRAQEAYSRRQKAADGWARLIRALICDLIWLATLPVKLVLWALSTPNHAMAAFTLIYVLVSGAQWISLRNQIDLTRTEFAMTQRPWVEIVRPEAKSSLTFDDKGGHLYVWFHLKNVGMTPARYIWVHAKLYTGQHDSSILIQQKQTCDDGTKQLGQLPAHVGSVLFQGGATYRPFNFTMDSADVERLRNDGPRGKATIRMVGCIDYMTAFSAEHHHTGFIYELDELAVPGQDARTVVIDPSKGNLDGGKIAFEINPYWYADVD